MTFSNEDKRAKLTVRISDKLRTKLNEFADSEGRSKAAVVRDAIRKEIHPHRPTDGREPPQEDDLRAAYLTLRDISTSEGWVRQDLALSEVAKATQRPKESIEATIIRELAQRGYLKTQSDFTGRHTSYKIRQ